MVYDENLLRSEFSLQLQFPGVLLTVLWVYAAKLNVLNHQNYPESLVGYSYKTKFSYVKPRIANR